MIPEGEVWYTGGATHAHAIINMSGAQVPIGGLAVGAFSVTGRPVLSDVSL